MPSTDRPGVPMKTWDVQFRDPSTGGIIGCTQLAPDRETAIASAQEFAEEIVAGEIAEGSPPGRYELEYCVDMTEFFDRPEAREREIRSLLALLRHRKEELDGTAELRRKKEKRREKRQRKKDLRRREAELALEARYAKARARDVAAGGASVVATPKIEAPAMPKISKPKKGKKKPAKEAPPALSPLDRALENSRGWVIALAVIIVVVAAAIGVGEYNTVRYERDDARMEVDVMERMLRAIEPLTADQEAALDAMQRNAERELRERCAGIDLSADDLPTAVYDACARWQ
jgi:hypothetical protein